MLKRKLNKRLQVVSSAGMFAQTLSIRIQSPSKKPSSTQKAVSFSIGQKEKPVEK